MRMKNTKVLWFRNLQLRTENNLKKKKIRAYCISCGKPELSKDEVGINMKLLGENVDNFYCLNCLADYLEVTAQEILDKIEEFKAEGCKLFD